jgi:hypothetical protein
MARRVHERVQDQVAIHHVPAGTDPQPPLLAYTKATPEQRPANSAPAHDNREQTCEYVALGINMIYSRRRISLIIFGS